MLLIHIFIFNQKRKFYINKGIRQLLLFAYVFQYNNKLLNKTFLNIHLSFLTLLFVHIYHLRLLLNISLKQLLLKEVKKIKHNFSSFFILYLYSQSYERILKNKQSRYYNILMNICI
jgi:hypothetical protein